jgi:hypothetical protein
MTDLSFYGLWAAVILAIIGVLRFDLLQMLWRESLRLFARSSPPGQPVETSWTLPDSQPPAAPDQQHKHRPAFHRSGRRA